MEKIQFKTKEELENHIKKIMKEISNERECDIYTHMTVYTGRERKCGENDTLDQRMSSILKYGLELDRYASIGGTMYHLGSSSDDDIAKKVVKYNYYQVQTKKVAIFALPKKVTVDGVVYDYSLADERLSKKFGEYGKHEERILSSLFDVIKDGFRLPTYYTLGAYIFDEENGVFEYVNPETHLAYNDKLTFENHDEKVVKDKVRDLIEKHGTKDVSAIIEKVSDETLKRVWYAEDTDISSLD